MSTKTPTSFGRSRTTGSRSGPSSRSLYASNNTTTSNSSTYIVALVEGLGQAKGEVGFAGMDIYNPQLRLLQFPDTTSYTTLLTVLNILNPCEIIMPKTVAEERIHSMLYAKLQQHYKGSVPIVPLDRRCFNIHRGLQTIRHLGSPSTASVEFEVGKMYYSLSAASALINYMERTLSMNFGAQTIQIVCNDLKDVVTIDFTSARLLELLADTQNGDNSLFRFLDYTVTRSGARTLRANILGPLRDIASIVTRQNVIESLAKEKDKFETLRAAVKGFAIDIDLVLANLVQFPNHYTEAIVNRRVDLTISLRHVLKQAAVLKQCLAAFEQNPLLVEYANSLDKHRYEEMLTLIDAAIEQTANDGGDHNPMLKQHSFCALKPNGNNYLALALQSFNEGVEDIYEEVRNTGERLKLGKFKVGYNRVRRYHFQLENGSLDPEVLNSNFLKIEEKKFVTLCTTARVLMFNNRLMGLFSEVVAQSSRVINELILSLTPFVGCVYTISEVVAKIDFLMSLTVATATYLMERPRFGTHTSIKDGNHPILMLTQNTVVANDIYLKPDSNLAIVMGPNMCGKTVFLKQVLLLQVIAQIGCYVPAKSALFRATSKIFTRLGSDDDLESSCSTFSKEVLGCQYILENITEESLVAIDELGRGTSTEEGVGFCFSVLERLSQTGAFVLAATHFHDLQLLHHIYYNVSLFKFKVDRGGDRAVFTHNLVQELQEDEEYGIVVAERHGMPPTITAKARELLAAMEKTEIVVDGEVQRNRKLAIIGYHVLSVAKKSNQLGDFDSVRNHLLHLRKQLQRSLHEIDHPDQPQPPAND